MLLVIASALVDRALPRYGVEQPVVFGHAAGQALENMQLRNNFV